MGQFPEVPPGDNEIPSENLSIGDLGFESSDVAIVWNSKTNDDFLALLDLDFCGEKNEDRTNERIGLYSAAACREALAILGDPENHLEMKRVVTGPGVPNANSLSWTSADDKLEIDSRTILPIRLFETEFEPKFTIDCPGEWLEGVAGRFGAASPIEVTITNQQEFPIGDDGQQYETVISQRFVIRDPTVPQIEWLGVKASPTDSDLIPDLSPQSAVGLILGFGEDSEVAPDIQFAAIDEYLVHSGLSKIREQADQSSNVSSEFDIALSADEKKEITFGIITAAFARLKELDTVELLPIDPENEIEGVPAARAIITRSTRDARDLLEEKFRAERVDPINFSNALANLASLASRQGDLESVREYCKIINEIPTDEVKPSLARAYFAASRLGDKDAEWSLGQLLDSENKEVFAKIQTFEGYMPRAHLDRHVLATIVHECAAFDSPLAFEYIEKYTVNPAQTDVVDETCRIPLLITAFDAFKNHGFEPETVSIDELLGRLSSTDMGRLAPGFIWSVIPDVLSKAKDSALKYELVQRFISLNQHDGSQDGSNFGRLAKVGYEVLEDEELSRSYPNLSEEIRVALVESSESLKPLVNIQGLNQLSEGYAHFNVSLMIHRGQAVDKIVEEIAAEQRRWIQDTATAFSSAGDVDLEMIAKASVAPLSRMYANAAEQYAAVGKFDESQEIASRITVTDDRVAAYETAWSHAKTPAQVQKLMPFEIGLGLFKEDIRDVELQIGNAEEQDEIGDVINLIPDAASGELFSDWSKKDGIVDDVTTPYDVANFRTLYDAAVAGKSGNKDQIVEKLRLLAAMSARFDPFALDESESISAMREMQLNLLFNSLAESEPIAAREIAPELIKARLWGNPNFVSHQMLAGFYLALEHELKYKSLDLVRETILELRSDRGTVRASRLAAFASHLETKV